MKLRPFQEIKYRWLLLIILTLVAVFLKSTYRNYIYANRLEDWGIADSSPNFFAGLITMILYELYHHDGKQKLWIWAMYTTIGLIGYELAQPLEMGKHYDHKDILASLLGVALGWIALWQMGVYDKKKSAPF